MNPVTLLEIRRLLGDQEHSVRDLVGREAEIVEVLATRCRALA